MDAERIDRLRPEAEPPRRPEVPVIAGAAAPRDHDLALTARADFRPASGPHAAGAVRVDVRAEPLAVRDGCAPGRIPAGRWPSDDALVRSEQFAVNEATRPLAGPGQPDPGRPGPADSLAVHAPAGTGVAEVFGDLVAAIITERARCIASLPDPAAAFGESRAWGAHAVAVPAPALTGFEIVLTAPEASAPTAYGLPPIGTRWRDPVARLDYFASTARLADGVGARAMLIARLGDSAANRAFADRWWRGAVRGTDVLFPAGESMAAALRRLTADRAAVDWPAAMTRFRSAAARAESLAEERAGVAAVLTRLSALEQACEEAAGTAEAAAAALAGLTAREPAVRASVLAAEEDRRTRLADLGAHELDRPVLATVTEPGRAALRTSGALSIAVSGGLRRGRNWRRWSVTRRELRAACATAVRQRDAAVLAAEGLRAGLAAARETADRATAEVARLTAELGPLAELVGQARQRWGDHVPDGPSQAETEDAALIEWRETSAPWADTEYATARADVFLAALELHQALIAARADVFAANLGALMERLGADQPPVAEPAAGEDSAAREDSAALLAAWRTFFLVVPVVQVTYEAAGTLVGGVGAGPLGWLLAGGAERLAPGMGRGILGHFDHAVLTGDSIDTAANALAGDIARARESAPAGDSTRAGDSAPAGNCTPAGDSAPAGNCTPAGDSALRIAERSTRYGTWLPSGPAGRADADGRTWVGTPLRVVRGLDRAVVDRRNDLAYDGLLICDRD